MLGYSSSSGSSRPLPALSLFFLQSWTSQLSCHKAAKPCVSYQWEEEAQPRGAKGRKGVLWSQQAACETCEHLQQSVAQQDSLAPGYHRGEAATTEVTLLSAQFLILNLRPWPYFLVSLLFVLSASLVFWFLLSSQDFMWFLDFWLSWK